LARPPDVIPVQMGVDDVVDVLRRDAEQGEVVEESARPHPRVPWSGAGVDQGDTTLAVQQERTDRELEPTVIEVLRMRRDDRLRLVAERLAHLHPRPAVEHRVELRPAPQVQRDHATAPSVKSMTWRMPTPSASRSIPTLISS